MMNDEIIARLTEVQAKYIDELMQMPNVVGVAIGLAKVAGEYTDTPAIVVMVSQKLPLEDLEEADVIPTELEGVRVDVQETGIFGAFTAL